MSSIRNEQALEEDHQDTLDIQAEIWENEKKWFEMQEEGIIEIGETKVNLAPPAKINFEDEYNT